MWGLTKIAESGNHVECHAVCLVCVAVPVAEPVAVSLLFTSLAPPAITGLGKVGEEMCRVVVIWGKSEDLEKKKRRHEMVFWE